MMSPVTIDLKTSPTKDVVYIDEGSNGADSLPSSRALF